MAESLSIHCPKCQAKLQLKNRSADGKKVPCPRCKEPFVIKLPKPKPKAKAKASPEDELDFLNEFDSFEDMSPPADEEDSGTAAMPPPAGRSLSTRSKKSPGSRKGSKKKSRNWQGPALIGGGAVLGLLLLVGLVFLVSNLSSGRGGASGNRLDLAYLPPDAESVTVIKVADLWNSPFLREFVEKPEVRQQIDSLQQKIGFRPEDIETITIGTAGLSNSMPVQKQLTEAMQQGDFNRLQELQKQLEQIQKVIVVVRMRKAIDREALRAGIENSTEATHGGASYYQVPRQNLFIDAFAAFPADGNTLVLGKEAEVKSAIERGGTAARRPEFDFVNTAPHVVSAVVPKDAALFNQQSTLAVTGGMPNLANLLQSSVKAVSLELTMTEGIDLGMLCQCHDANAAAQCATAFESELAAFRQKPAEPPTGAAALMPFMAEMNKVTDELKQSARASRSDSTVTVSASIPSSIKSVLTNAASTFQSSFGGGIPSTPAGSVNPGGTPNLPITPPIDPNTVPADPASLFPGVNPGSPESQPTPPGAVPPGSPTPQGK